jgi:hypothetical protein
MKGKLKTGVVEKVEFTMGGAGNQWTTIAGVKYATWWDARDADWKVGDCVQFEERMQPIPLHGDTPRPTAWNIKKAPAFKFTRPVEQGEDDDGLAVFGFDCEGTFVHDPFKTLCGEHSAHPPEEYDISWADADALRALNAALAEATQAAINAACKAFQDAAGGLPGDVAGMHFSDKANERAFSKGIADYIQGELLHLSED